MDRLNGGDAAVRGLGRAGSAGVGFVPRPGWDVGSGCARLRPARRSGTGGGVWRGMRESAEPSVIIGSDSGFWSTQILVPERR